MKRIIVVVGVVSALGAIGLTAAHAASSGPSTWCTNGQGDTEANVPNSLVTASAEHWDDWNDWELFTLCWSTTPVGSTAPEAAGGNVQLGVHENGTVRLACHGDRTAHTVATVDCENLVTPTDPSSAPGTTASGSVKVGTVGPVPLGQTGAEVNPGTSTNAPLNPTTAGSGGTVGIGAGTCTWVNGGSPTCPFGFGATVAGVTVNEADASVPTTHPNSGGCVTVPGNPCATTAPDGFGVRFLKGDTTRDTVTVEVLGRTESRDLGGCVGFNAGTGC